MDGGGSVATIATLASIAMLGLPPSVHAQSWNVTAAKSGQLVISSVDAQGNSSGPVVFPWLPYDRGFGRPVASSPGTSATETNSGTLTFTYTWDGGRLNLPPPNKVWVHETSSAAWGATGDTYGSKTGSSSTGLFDTIVDLSTPDGLNAGQIANGSKWEEEDSSSGTFTVSISPQATLSVSQPPLAAGEDQFSAQQGGAVVLSADTAIGDRTIITNGDIETSYYKTYDPNTSETTVASHQRAGDGSISTDSAVTWNGSLNSTPRGWGVMDTPFHATSPFNLTTYSWTATDGGFDYGSGTGPNDPEALFMITKPDEDSFPLAVTIKVKATGEREGEKDSNSFTVIYHLPLEKTKLLSTVKSGQVLETLMEDVAPGEHKLVKAQSAQKLDVGGAVDGVAAYFTFTGQKEFAFAAEIVKSFAAFTKLEYDVAGKDAYDGGENVGDEWQVAQADNENDYPVMENGQLLPNIPDCDALHHQDGWLFCKLGIKVIAQNQDDTWQADGYNSHGFDGNDNHRVTAHRTANVENEPFYYQYKPIPPDWPDKPWPPPADPPTDPIFPYLPIQPVQGGPQ